MEKLIEKYKKECDILSKLPSRIWKAGQIIIVIGSLIYCFRTLNYIVAFVLPIILGCVLYKICADIELVDITKKLKLKYKYKEFFRNFKVRDKIYNSYSSYQKNWITKYCKKNKLNNIEKLKILREELDKKNTPVKYINPVIIGTLMITGWEFVIQYFWESVGLLGTIIVVVFSAFVISIAVAWLKKEWNEQMEFFREFDRFSGTDRLQELLVYRMLKMGK